MKIDLATVLVHLMMFSKCVGSYKLGRLVSRHPRAQSYTRMMLSGPRHVNNFDIPNISTRLFATTDIKKVPTTPDALANIFDIELPTNENNNDLLKIRHSTAHVMAMAVQKVYPEARVTIGPWIDNG